MADYNELTDLNGLSAGDIVTYSYTGAAVPLYLPKGKYRLKCYGAQGGFRSTASYGGQGGYAEGVVNIESAIQAFVYVGGSGNTCGGNGGFNGGGTRTNNLPGGGGASDIRLGADSLFARVIVAGGGGSDGAGSRPGGNGGGETGVSRGESYGSGGGGASQTDGGSYDGAFGVGGNGRTASGGYGGAGGGGWYGGGGVQPDGSADDDRGGGGGSGYALTASSVKPAGYLLGEEYYLTETVLMQGGRNGDGLIIIEIIEIGAQKFLARDEDGVKAWNGEAWELCESEITEELFLTFGVDRLPQSVSGLLEDAEILLWTDNEEIRTEPENFSLQLTANVTAPTQTVTQVVPFGLPSGAVVDRFVLVKDERNGGMVSADFTVEDNKIRFVYTLEKPDANAVTGLVKQNIYFNGV